MKFSHLSKKGVVALGLLTLFITVAVASDKPTKPQDVPAKIIAHVSLPTPAGSQMLLQKKSGKEYLYIQQASKQGYMIVDVTKANKPNVLKGTATESQATAGSMEMVGPDVAIAESSGKQPPATNSVPRPAESVRVLDMSDPANPKTLQTFDNVTSILPDSGRIYLTNDAGLWVLRYSQYRNRPLPPCDSESAFSPIADCQ